MAEHYANIVSQVTTDVGDALRMVACFDRDGYEILSIRDDVSALRSEEDFEMLYDVLIFERTKKEMYERLIDAGELRMASHRFDDILLSCYYVGTDEGLVVSIDADADIREGLLFDHVSSWLGGGDQSAE